MELCWLKGDKFGHTGSIDQPGRLHTDEDFFPIDTALPHSLAYLGFITIHLRSIEVSSIGVIRPFEQVSGPIGVGYLYPALRASKAQAFVNSEGSSTFPKP